MGLQSSLGDTRKEMCTNAGAVAAHPESSIDQAKSLIRSNLADLDREVNLLHESLGDVMCSADAGPKVAHTPEPLIEDPFVIGSSYERRGYHFHQRIHPRPRESHSQFLQVDRRRTQRLG
jgi:hypothetical protein